MFEKNSIISYLNEVCKKFKDDVFVGGSCSLVLNNKISCAKDIDIIQHKGEKIVFPYHSEKRLWSLFYPEIKVDMHYSNPQNIRDFPKCFHKIIFALDYIDNKHYDFIDGWKVISIYGSGLVNWVHHFLEYGYNNERTINPNEKDEKELRNILGNYVYETIQWKVDTEKLNETKN